MTDYQPACWTCKASFPDFNALLLHHNSHLAPIAQKVPEERKDRTRDRVGGRDEHSSKKHKKKHEKREKKHKKKHSLFQIDSAPVRAWSPTPTVSSVRCKLCDNYLVSSPEQSSHDVNVCLDCYEREARKKRTGLTVKELELADEQTLLYEYWMHHLAGKVTWKDDRFYFETRLPDSTYLAYVRRFGRSPVRFHVGDWIVLRMVGSSTVAYGILKRFYVDEGQMRMTVLELTPRALTRTHSETWEALDFEFGQQLELSVCAIFHGLKVRTYRR